MGSVSHQQADGTRFKGLPLGGAWALDEIPGLGWNVAQGDTATPVATLSMDAVRANAAAMRDWCAAHDVSLAPHAKTTLSPELIEVQRDDGVWAMTAALPRQVELLWQQGISRVMMANELTDPAAILWLASRLAGDPALELFLYADSVANVAILDAAVQEEPGDRPLDILIELGHKGGRSGARTVAAAVAVAEAVIAAPRLRLAGIALFEGTLGATRTPETISRVDAFLTQLAALLTALADRFEVDEPIVTAGGSHFFDRVVSVLATTSHEQGARLVLRSGCYLIHDHGIYGNGTPSAAGVRDAPTFRAALNVWARVVSCPEPGLALLDAGRRDLSFDAGLPIPLERSRGTDRLDLEHAARIDALGDQHAFLRFERHVDVAPGDLVRLGISHPCTTFDRWDLMLVVDEDDLVVGTIRTDF
jgi:D-serine deaminase-like pyridoxal phosphate-dependent protein